jgi:hypothetical protein
MVLQSEKSSEHFSELQMPGLHERPTHLAPLNVGPRHQYSLKLWRDANAEPGMKTAYLPFASVIANPGTDCKLNLAVAQSCKFYAILWRLSGERSPQRTVMDFWCQKCLLCCPGREDTK